MNKNKNIVTSFKYAIIGILTALKQEKNLRIHFVAGILAIFASFAFNLDNKSKAGVVMITALVLVAELINTAIEAIVDLVCGSELNPYGKIAKDVAAGAVFISALSAVIVGILLFFA